MGKCASFADGKTTFIKNGNLSSEVCFRLAEKCTGTREDAKYWSTAHLISGDEVYVCNEVILDQKRSSGEASEVAEEIRSPTIEADDWFKFTAEHDHCGLQIGGMRVGKFVRCK